MAYMQISACIASAALVVLWSVDGLMQKICLSQHGEGLLYLPKELSIGCNDRQMLTRRTYSLLGADMVACAVLFTKGLEL